MKTKEEAFVFMTFLCGVNRSGQYLFFIIFIIFCFVLHATFGNIFFFLGLRVC